MMTRQRRGIGFWGAGALVLAACGQQAGQDYAGEPLLRLRGQAVVSALTGGQPVEPALCFFLADGPKAPQLDLDVLPAELRAGLMYEGQSVIEMPMAAGDRLATHILDVESRGEFPAQFDVDVYQPPPSAGLSAPHIAGEPRWALGSVCAVTTDHAAVTFPFAHGGQSDSTSARFDYAVLSLSEPRFYYERYDCPPGTLPQFAMSECTKTSAGDPNMAFEFPSTEYRSESVLGSADELEVLYLEEPAPAGSYTAFVWGAAEGLAAGYHLFAQRPKLPEGVPPADVECRVAAQTEAELVNEEMLGARIRAALGEDFRYNGLGGYSMTQQQHRWLPQDLFLEARETEARMHMKHCPLSPRAPFDPSASTLSIDFDSDASPDLSRQFGFVSGPGVDADEPSEGPPSE